MVKMKFAPMLDYYVCQVHGSLASFSLFKYFKSTESFINYLRKCRTNNTLKLHLRLKCPVCFKKMFQGPIAEQSPVTIEQCIHCDSIWFDNAEMRQVFKEYPQSKELLLTMNSNTKLNSEVIAGRDLDILNYFGIPTLEATPQQSSNKPIIIWILFIITIALTYRGLKSHEFLFKMAHDPKAVSNGNYLKLISSGFVHVSWFHCFMNMYFFHTAGNRIEEEFGSLLLTGIYLSSIFGGSILYQWAGGIVPSVGASGGVFGLLVFFCLSFPESKFNLPIFPRSRILNRMSNGSILQPYVLSISAPLFLIIYLLPQLFGAILKISGYLRGGGVNYLAHIGGALVGFLFFISLSSSKKLSY